MQDLQKPFMCRKAACKLVNDAQSSLLFNSELQNDRWAHPICSICRTGAFDTLTVCSIHLIVAGAIPESWSNFTELSSFIVSNNQLSGKP